MAPLRAQVQPFAGRVGGNQELVIDRDDPRSAEVLDKAPDAAPLMTAREGLSLQGFLNVDYWKFGLVEGIGKSNQSPVVPTGPAGVFATVNFLGPIFGGLGNWLFLTLFIFTFSNVSGSHLNPTITMATFFARLISFPRMVIYIFSQTAGGTLAGLMLRAGYGTSDFTVGGCFVDTNLVPVDEAFLLEFIFCLLLIFLSFGVGLDPRQGTIYGPALSPFLVGMVLFGVSWSSAFTRAGFAGASVNPARCFGVYVATAFPSYHWIHWVGFNPKLVGPVAASIGHGIVYYVVPPWRIQEP
ncbi:MIP transporter [Penicillium maclennaniae]|uniref:MIP transporter n=1 Tax=Penicillium maclennaniae TaxID=1343394 RepID=UPI002540BC0F|nr:MIP transporter [Penicillium maclennaniae]KAJ5666337.1 MIP transporter [Penicillium maclennaniae]